MWLYEKKKKKSQLQQQQQQQGWLVARVQIPRLSHSTEVVLAARGRDNQKALLDEIEQLSRKTQITPPAQAKPPVCANMRRAY
jgi:hypothetical protein